MKIYSKKHLFAGIFAACIGLIAAFDLLGGETPLEERWIALFFFAAAANSFYWALSKDGLEEADKRRAYYTKVALLLHGKHYSWKASLPILLVVILFIGILLWEIAFDTPFPTILMAIWLLPLFLAMGYSIGLRRSVTEYIDAHTAEELSQL